jgi:hypothetical protein
MLVKYAELVGKCAWLYMFRSVYNDVSYNLQYERQGIC